MKRVFDLIGASLMLLLFFPIMIFIALCIKIDSPGTIFFCQSRGGLDGKNITIWKFRTLFRCEKNCQLRTLIATRDDPRITNFGKFLRRTHLDELPQLWNVLKGDMSLVGPRPHPQSILPELEKKITSFKDRHRVRPGLTGPAQIHKRDISDGGIQKSARLDIEYATTPWNAWRDMKIIFLTIKVVMHQQGI